MFVQIHLKIKVLPHFLGTEKKSTQYAFEGVFLHSKDERRQL